MSQINPYEIRDFYKGTNKESTHPEAELSNAWFCGRQLAGIVGSNPAGGMDICLLCVVS